jgi:hypothetical protein
LSALGLLLALLDRTQDISRLFDTGQVDFGPVTVAILTGMTR